MMWELLLALKATTSISHVWTSILENLPAEIRIQVLRDLTDFPSLRSLVRASPLYHITYLQTRDGVLCHLALQQLDHRLRPDALAAVRSARHYEVHGRKSESVLAFLDEHGRARENAAHSKSEWLSCRSTTEAVDLLHLHEAVKRVTEEYCHSIASKKSQEQEQE